MMFEIHKIFSIRLLDIMLAVVVSINLVLFALACQPLIEVCSGYSLSASSSEVQRQIANQTGYHQWQQDYLQEMQIKEESGLFGDADSAGVQELKHGISIYRQLDDVYPSVVFQGNAAMMLKWQLSFWLSVLLVMLASLYLFLQEKKDGMMLIIHSTPSCRQNCMHKITALFVYGVIAFLLCQISQAIAAGIMLGRPVLSQPIQGVDGFLTCPWHMQVGQYLFASVMYYILLLLLAAVFSGLIGYLSSSVFSFAGFAAVAAAIGWWLSKSSHLFLNRLSFLVFCDFSSFYNHTFLVFLPGIAVEEHIYAFIGAAIVTVLLLLVVEKCYVYHIGKVKCWRLPSVPAVFGSLRMMESRKLMRYSCGILMLMCCVGLEVWHFHSVQLYLGPSQYTYRHYSSLLNGTKSEQKEQMLREEKERLEGEAGKGVDVSASQIGLERAQKQYDSLSDDMPYVYQDGYVMWCSDEGMQYLFLSHAAGLICTVVAMCFYMAMDEDCGVLTLQRASGARNAITRHQMHAALFYGVVMGLLTSLPWFLKVSETYGFADLMAPVAAAMPGEFSFPRLQVVFLFVLQIVLSVGLYESVPFAAKIVCRHTHTIVGTLTICGVIYAAFGALLYLVV